MLLLLQVRLLALPPHRSLSLSLSLVLVQCVHLPAQEQSSIALPSTHQRSFLLPRLSLAGAACVDVVVYEAALEARVGRRYLHTRRRYLPLQSPLPPPLMIRARNRGPLALFR
jgi:hypothetical protein